MPAVIILICILSGVLAGVGLRGRTRIIAWVDRLALASVLVLVWLLGASMGANEEVVSRLGTLGLQAVVIAVAAMVGSVVLVEVVHRLWFGEDAR
jgi:hypothetical protein